MLNLATILVSIAMSLAIWFNLEEIGLLFILFNILIFKQLWKLR
jgi:hypothetical protein